VAHAVHTPLSQTSPAPQGVPFAAGFEMWVSVQTGVPVPHAICPVSQMLAGATKLHDVPAEQLAQLPLSQTAFAMHAVPFAAVLGIPVSRQAIVPVAHDVMPKSQGFWGVHDCMAVQLTQVPPLHTMLAPHDVPFGSGPFPLHTGPFGPVQSKPPWVQGSPGGLHGLFWTHAPQTPLSQYRFVPQEVPFG